MRRRWIGLLFLSIVFLVSFVYGGENLHKIDILKVTASSYDSTDPKKWPHYPEMIIDNNRYTCWASSRNNIIGAWLKFNFKQKVTISRIDIINGWIPKNYPNFFLYNHRAKQITLIYNNGEKESFILKDTNEKQSIFPRKKILTDTLTITIDKIYKAKKGNDPWITISEICFYQ